MRRALLLCLLGSVLTLLAASRGWTQATIDHGPTLPLERVGRTGQQLEPGLRPLAFVGLAAVAALLATRRWGRTAVGVVVAACGGVIVGLSLQHGLHLWPMVSAVGGVVLLAGGGLAVLRGHRWGGLSEAYRTPGVRAEQVPVTDKGVWDALDRGEDPTADPHG